MLLLDPVVELGERAVGLVPHDKGHVHSPEVRPPLLAPEDNRPAGRDDLDVVLRRHDPSPDGLGRRIAYCSTDGRRHQRITISPISFSRIAMLANASAITGRHAYSVAP